MPHSAGGYPSIPTEKRMTKPDKSERKDGNESDSTIHTVQTRVNREENGVYLSIYFVIIPKMD